MPDKLLTPDDGSGSSVRALKRMKLVCLERLSVCNCGYSVLADEIQLGAKYTVDLESFKLGMYRCGRCGNRKEVQIVLASQQLHPGRPMAYLPAELFGLTVVPASQRAATPGPRKKE